MSKRLPRTERPPRETPPLAAGAGMISVTDFGAQGDGKTDCTRALQSAIDLAASRGGGGVWFPAGLYRSGTLRVPSFVGLFGAPTWSYQQGGATQIVLADRRVEMAVENRGGWRGGRKA